MDPIKALQGFVNSNRTICEVYDAFALLETLIKGNEGRFNVDLHDNIIYDNLQECKQDNNYLYFSITCRLGLSNEGEINATTLKYKMAFDRMVFKSIENIPCIIIYSQQGNPFGKDDELAIADGDYIVIHDKSYSKSLYKTVQE